MSAALSRATGVSKRFGSGDTAVTALHEVDLTVAAGELTLLMGPSGSGKTTLVSILAGLLWPSEGRVELCGAPISTLDEAGAAAVRRRHVGFIFQGYNLFPGLRALDNVALGYRLRGLARAEARGLARDALDTVGLADRADHLPGKLSSGQKQRVAIARALAGAPALLIGDEPTAALDSSTAMGVMRLLRERVTPSAGVLVVTHDPRLQRFAHRTVYMEDGRIVREERHEAQEGARV
ncbi:MAG: ABC transporter ATP-binding protein, partial [Polyangiales bacterium]